MANDNTSGVCNAHFEFSPDFLEKDFKEILIVLIQDIRQVLSIMDIKLNSIMSFIVNNSHMLDTYIKEFMEDVYDNRKYVEDRNLDILKQFETLSQYINMDSVIGIISKHPAVEEKCWFYIDSLLDISKKYITAN